MTHRFPFAAFQGGQGQKICICHFRMKVAVRKTDMEPMLGSEHLNMQCYLSGLEA